MDPLESALKYFQQDFERHIHQGQCPWKKAVSYQQSAIGVNRISSES
jgi:NADH-quinone oxidoreductase subunit F